MGGIASSNVLTKTEFSAVADECAAVGPSHVAGFERAVHLATAGTFFSIGDGLSEKSVNKCYLCLPGHAYHACN